MKMPKSRNIEAIKIDPFTRTVAPLNLLYDNVKGLQSLAYEMSNDRVRVSFVERILTLIPQHELWVDEEGLLKANQPWYFYDYANQVYTPIVGVGIVTKTHLKSVEQHINGFVQQAIMWDSPDRRKRPAYNFAATE